MTLIDVRRAAVVDRSMAELIIGWQSGAAAPEAPTQIESSERVTPS